jgi:putative tryptophan/tyrosine transport system substrate-binding protein
MTHWSRRQLVQGAGAVSLGLLAGCGRPSSGTQSPPRVYRLGWLGSGALPQPFREGLQELGYVEGQNLVVELRDPGERSDRAAQVAAALVTAQVDVIAAPGSEGVRAAKEVTSTIPIVGLGGGGDLVSLGHVESLARPGANVTGLTNPNDSLIGKRLQLLMEAAGPLARVVVLWDGTVPVGLRRPLYEDPARELGLDLLVADLREPMEFEQAFADATQQGADSVYVTPTPLMIAQRARVYMLAARHKLPAVYAHLASVRDGGLMAYTGRTDQMQRRAAYYVDRVLRGGRPADLPIEQAREFDFAINLKTAQALGLTIPHHVLLQATEVIQ